ncbi:hypothetical protein [Leuconostoc falkenbergense]|uniref:hypothetical protein n=1 Tax=Leuconostoc falkenbergense TaxID=2766470 RepID=UPI00196754B8|nr:hypothetical protein [Leuconostoc falkenbergense]QSB50756.1 hypothetical protein I6J31_05520 [Leuconostoc falkenbergense]
MTEPVAYIYNYANGDYALWHKTEQHIEKAIPLYTKEQLQPRVKLTKKQYDRLMWDKINTDLSTCISYFLEHDGVNKFGLSSENLRGDLTQEDIARAWLNPEETIEIFPTMKWFVRSKEQYKPDMDQGISESGYLYLTQGNIYSVEYYETTSFKDDATQFDTKEEAEKWTNPLTEAVQLPVEGE